MHVPPDLTTRGYITSHRPHLLGDLILSQQLLTSCSFSSRSGGTRFLHADCDINCCWNCTDLVWAATLLWFHGRNFPAIGRSHNLTAGLLVLRLPQFFFSLWCSLSLRGRDCVVAVPAGAQHPMVCCSVPFDLLWPSTMVSFGCKKKFLFEGTI